jgi:GT2 family glycosyltransferase
MDNLIVTETSYPHGACMMIRKKCLEELGLLYEGYFLYYEELDFAERVKSAYKIYFQPHFHFFIKNLFLPVK